MSLLVFIEFLSPRDGDTKICLKDENSEVKISEDRMSKRSADSQQICNAWDAWRKSQSGYNRYVFIQSRSRSKHSSQASLTNAFLP